MANARAIAPRGSTTLRNPRQRARDSMAIYLGSHTAAARAKQRAAATSVMAGLGLTVFKVIVGLATGSLGILAEAAHSGLDLVAALMTFFAVRLSDRPADPSHPYGHGKVENLSAFIEAGLLLLTAVWVGYEAISRLLISAVHVDASAWAFTVMLVSIVTDIGRSRALRKAASEHRSQALEADALHFSTDIWSSLVVLLGLAAVRIGDWTGWGGPWERADAFGALGVCGVVLFVGGRMVRATVDALLDRAPEALVDRITVATRSVPGVIGCSPPRIRRVGNKLFADLVVQISRTETFPSAHAVTEAVEDAVRAAAPEGEIDLVLQMEPATARDEHPDDTIRYLAREQGLRVHDVRVLQVGTGALEADVHVEVDPDLSLSRSHARVEHLEETALAAVPGLRALNTHLEVLAPGLERRRDITGAKPEIVDHVRLTTERLVVSGACHDVRVYDHLPSPDQPGIDRISGSQAIHDLVLHVAFPGNLGIPAVHEQSEDIERALRATMPGLNHVLIHAEPQDA
jgi:cation diffusion facilitator family transporter